MKKIIVSVLAVSCALSLCCGCGSAKNDSASSTLETTSTSVIESESANAKAGTAPTGVNDQTFSQGSDALSIADNYLDQEGDAQKVSDSLTAITKTLNSLSLDKQAESLNNQLISISIESMGHDIQQGNNDDLLKDRNVLAQYLGQATRN